MQIYCAIIKVYMSVWASGAFSLNIAFGMWSAAWIHVYWGPYWLGGATYIVVLRSGLPAWFWTTGIYQCVSFMVILPLHWCVLHCIALVCIVPVHGGAKGPLNSCSLPAKGQPGLWPLCYKYYLWISACIALVCSALVYMVLLQ